MKCIICSVEIDEARVIPPLEGPGGRLIEDLTSKLVHARELEKWICATITAQVLGGCKTIRSGHLCPAHKVDELTFALAPASTSASAATKPESKNESKGK